MRGHLARTAAIASVAFTLIEAILGALLVKLGPHSAEHIAAARALSCAAPRQHVAAAGSLALTAHLLSRARGYLRGDVRLVAPFGAALGIVVVLAVGVTGSLAALGDTLFPAHSLSSALTQDFAAGSTWLLRWRWTHPTIAFLACVFLIWLLVRAAQRNAYWDNRVLSAVVLILLATQYILGVLDVTLLAPVWLQIAHLLGADALWIALIVLTARLTLQPASAQK